MIHSALPPSLEHELDVALAAAGIRHVAHGAERPVDAGVAAASDPAALALVGPVRSRAVAETVEATAPAGLPLIAPLATWAGVTRDDEPGCEDDPADHRGTVFRLVARDTEVAARIAADVRRAGRRAVVVAGDHEYGAQLDGQLRLAGLPRAETEEADLVVLCGFADGPEIALARSLAPLPVIAFDGAQGADLDMLLALPFASDRSGAAEVRRAGALLVRAVRDGARDRASVLAWLRAVGEFDEHGDPVAPDVWLWRGDVPERPL